ncbi:hypothetical protein K438DRAFT_2023856 [Mycena galopus ATCC 62051]|nr:hypothetical protein K438DRAFT_2023856 [Mycena galopus ATCC 62051]
MASLLDLPTELLMEIIKCYPQLYHFPEVPTHRYILEKKHLRTLCELHGWWFREQFVGNDVLRALTQTCRLLRNIFLHMLWARLDAFFTQRTINMKGGILERRMIGIQQTPYVVPHIQSLIVTMAECTMDHRQPMAEFIRVLEILPNLQELTIVQVRPEMVSVMRDSFRGKVFPSVLSLAPDNRLGSIMPCFPNVQTMYIVDSPSAGILRATKGSCYHIHTVRHFRLSPGAIQALRAGVPNVRRLDIQWNCPLDFMPLLNGMAALSDLRIQHFHIPGIPGYRPRRSLEDVLSGAKEVLRSSKATALMLHIIPRASTLGLVVSNQPLARDSLRAPSPPANAFVPLVLSKPKTSKCPRTIASRQRFRSPCPLETQKAQMF